MALFQAIEQAKSDDPNKVAETLADMEYEGLTGTEKYRGCDHQAVKPYYTLRCKSEKEMQTPDDFADIIGFSNNLAPCEETGCKL